MGRQLEKGSIPVALGSMGYHSAVISQKQATYHDSRYQAKLAHSLRTMEVPDTGQSRASAISDGAHSSSSGVSAQVAPPALKASGSMVPRAPALASSIPAYQKSSSAPEASQALVVVDQKSGMPSSEVRNQSLLLRQGHQLQHVDFEAIADSSVGGNGLPRPYGRFIAARDGNGLSMWQRIPVPKLEQNPTVGPPPIREPPLSDVNITQINVQRKKYNLRNLRSDVPINNPHKSVFKDKITNLPESLLSVDPEARSRPWNPELGREYYASRINNRDSGRINLPAASFLNRKPIMPPNVRVDCGHETTHSHLSAHLPSPAQEWNESGRLDSTDLPRYSGQIIHTNGEVEIVRRPAANRNKLLHPAVVEYMPPQIAAAPAPQPRRQERPLHLPPMPQVAEADGDFGSTFLTQQ